MYLFKRVSDDMSGLSLGKKVPRMLQSLTSMIELITVSCMLKAMHVAFLTYLALKAPLKMTIYVYYIIHQINIYTDT